MKPILFKAEMVRAILENRKSQTRRIVKFNRSHRVQKGSKQWHVEDPNAVLAAPLGQPGDRLWVKETFQSCPSCFGVNYRADNDGHRTCHHCGDTLGKWKPSIFMRREYSRLDLELTAVRCERLNDISDADVEAEGTSLLEEHQPSGVGHKVVSKWWRYRHLWESINGPGSWAQNPWVWCYSFKKIDPK